VDLEVKRLESFSARYSRLEPQNKAHISKRNKKSRLSLRKTRYRLYSSCCSTDL